MSKAKTGKSWKRAVQRRRFRRAMKSDRDIGTRIGTKRMGQFYYGDGPNQRDFARNQED